jgi:hypothetical protein
MGGTTAGRTDDRRSEVIMRAHAYGGGSAAVTIGVLALLTAVAMPTRADAFIPTVNYVTDTSLYNSSTTKMVYAACAAGEAVLGGSASIKGADGQVNIQAAFPMHDVGLGLYIFVVKATEDASGTADNWSITAGAYCTPDTMPIYDEASSAFDSTPIKSATIACPANTKVVGMGGEVSIRPTGEVGALFDTIPDALVVFQGFELNDDLTQVTARATELAGALGGVAPQMWRVTAVVACSQPYNFDGLTLLKKREVGGGFLAFETDSSVETSCALGQRIIGAGSRVDDHDQGQWYLDRMSRYNAFQSRVVAEATRNAGTSLTKQTVYVVCVD